MNILNCRTSFEGNTYKLKYINKSWRWANDKMCAIAFNAGKFTLMGGRSTEFIKEMTMKFPG